MYIDTCLSHILVYKTVLTDVIDLSGNTDIVYWKYTHYQQDHYISSTSFDFSLASPLQSPHNLTSSKSWLTWTWLWSTHSTQSLLHFVFYINQKCYASLVSVNLYVYTHLANKADSDSDPQFVYAQFRSQSCPVVAFVVTFNIQVSLLKLKCRLCCHAIHLETFL